MHKICKNNILLTRNDMHRSITTFWHTKNTEKQEFTGNTTKNMSKHRE